MTLRQQVHEALDYVNIRMAALCNDPMTAAMGCPVGDFHEQWEREARREQAKMLNRLKQLNLYPRLQNHLVEALTSHI